MTAKNFPKRRYDQYFHAFWFWHLYLTIVFYKQHSVVRCFSCPDKQKQSFDFNCFIAEVGYMLLRLLIIEPGTNSDRWFNYVMLFLNVTLFSFLVFGAVVLICLKIMIHAQVLLLLDGISWCFTLFVKLPCGPSHDPSLFCWKPQKHLGPVVQSPIKVASDWPYSGIRISGIAVRFLLWGHFCNISLIHENLRAILYSSNSKNLLRGIFCHHSMHSYSGIGSIERNLC